VIVTIATGQRQTLYSGNGRHPAWSPTGQLIAFSARLDLEPNELFVVPAAGGAVQRITTNEVADRHPNWVRREP
jgi:Tol biopolymer transport system component